jgi:[protein-PII] uridylyltransferase
MNLANIKTELQSVLDDTPDDFITIKQALKASNQALYALYQQQNTEISDLLAARSSLIDFVLQFFWQHHQLDQHKTATLVAVGGYGRAEMHPASDIDLLVLLSQELDTECQQDLSQFITLLWDIGLDIGHSVRTLAECVSEAKEDVTIITNLIESRFLIGQLNAYQQLKEMISPENIWNSQAFLKAKLDEQAQRYKKYGHTAYRVEPNLKEGPGGLRDIQTIIWVMQRHYGLSSLSELKTQGLLSQEEYEELNLSRDFLWEIRFVLHNLSQRKEERLLFQHQQQLAKAFGFDIEAAANRAVERFMMQYYRVITNLDRLNSLLLNLLKETILPSHDYYACIINHHYEERNGLINLREADLFTQQPYRLLEIFLILQTTPKAIGISSNTIRSIRHNLHRIDTDFRNNSQSQAIFISIMQQQKGVNLALRKMNQYGVLAAYIPAFQHIVGLMQFDLFHAFTVDEHTLYVIRNVRRYSTSEGQEELPFCSKIFNQLEKPELLYLAALFHDIAKGRGGDHAKLGALDAYQFCREHHLSKADAQIVSWLVEKHLFLSMIVQKKDISDPDVIAEFAKMFRSSVELDYLYLLTVADIRGTNLKLWTSWKASLLRQFYIATRQVLKSNDNTKKVQKVTLKKKKAAALLHLAQYGINQQECQQHWKNLDSGYFLKHSLETICWHTHSILSQQDYPIVELRQSTKNSSVLFIYQKGDLQLFVRIAATLEQLNINTVEAKIISSHNGFDLYTFHILNVENKPLSESQDKAQLIQSIRHNIQTEYIPDTSTRRMPRELQHLDVPTHIRFSQNIKKSWTVLEIETGDRPGLLSLLGKVLYQQGIQIHDAKISTLEEQAQDVFQITDGDNAPIKVVKQLETIKQAIYDSLA